jgi:hypothetical protein
MCNSENLHGYEAVTERHMMKATGAVLYNFVAIPPKIILSAARSTSCDVN